MIDTNAPRIGQNLSRRKYRYQLCISISRLGIFSIPEHNQASARFILTSRSSYVMATSRGNLTILRQRREVERRSSSVERATNRVGVSEDGATHGAHMRNVSEPRAKSVLAPLPARRFSCSRYIGQPRRLSRFLRAIHLHALLSACTYLSSPGLSSPPSPPLLASVDHTLQEAFPLSRPDLAKCRDPRGVSRYNIALLDVCTCLATIFLSPRVLATFSRRSPNILLFVSDYIKFHFTPSPGSRSSF